MTHRQALGAAVVVAAVLASACGHRIEGKSSKDGLDTARRHIDAFAAAEMLGDDAGGPGETAAMDYVRKHFETLGLEPVVRTVPLVQMTPTSTFARVTAADGQPLPLEPANGKDYLVWAGQQKAEVSVKSGAIFAGYGIVSPEYKRDDYKGVDVKGKIVVVLEGSPHTADRDDLGALGESYYGRRFYKFAEGWRQGAAAVLIVHGGLQSWDEMRQQATGAIIDIEADAINAESKAAVEGWLSLPAAMRLFGAARLDFNKQLTQARELAFQPVPLGNLQIEIRLTSTITRTVTRSVVGILRGQIPEYVMLASQWNGLPFVPNAPAPHEPAAAPVVKGVGMAIIAQEMAPGGRKADTSREHASISGLTGDGSGGAVVLEAARRLVAQRRKPLRNIVFMVASALKPGVVALQHWVDHPMFPLNKTVGMVFIDQASPTEAKQGVGKIGTSSDDALSQMARTAAIGQGRLLVLDQNSERRFYYKYGQAAFGSRGVPTIYLTTPPQSLRRVQAGAPAATDLNDDAKVEIDPDLDAMLLTTLVRRVADATNWRPASMSATALAAASAR